MSSANREKILSKLKKQITINYSPELYLLGPKKKGMNPCRLLWHLDVLFLPGELSVDMLKGYLKPCLDKDIALIFDQKVIDLNPCVRAVIHQLFEVACEWPVSRPEPTSYEIEDASREIRKFSPNLVVSVGGGSTIDFAKGISHLVPEIRSLPNLFESPGKFSTALPHVAFPTTSGPGTEISPAMIYRRPDGRKMAIVDERLIPEKVIISTDLLVSLPPFETACCVFDGICHCVEILLNPSCPYIAQELATVALSVFLSELMNCQMEHKNIFYRLKIAEASLLSSLALRITGAGVSHIISGPISRLIEVPHGVLVSSILLPFLWHFVSNKHEKRLVYLAEKFGYEKVQDFVESLFSLFQDTVLKWIDPIKNQIDTKTRKNWALEALSSPRLVNLQWNLDLNEVLFLLDQSIAMLQTRKIAANGF